MSANNYLGALPCTYDSNDSSGDDTSGLCVDVSANNYLGALPCTYDSNDSSGDDTSGLCVDVSANNYLGALPCTYDSNDSSGDDTSGLCVDVSANNYLGALPCTYDLNFVCTNTGSATGEYYTGVSHSTMEGACENLVDSMILGGENSDETLHGTFGADLCQLFYSTSNCYSDSSNVWTDAENGNTVYTTATCGSV